MSLQTCPNCNKQSFTWSIDEEESPLTYWGCYKCEYGAYEDESQERICSNCGKKTESRMKDEEKEYWWCSSCNATTKII